MCGISCVYHVKPEELNMYKEKMLKCSRLLRHRGPDWSGMKIVNQTILCHERLAIVGVDSGAQPIVSKDSSIVLSVNGEIYNHHKLQKLLKKPREFMTHSDCEVILYLYEDYGPNFAGLLDGMFSFVLYDTVKDKVIVARDPIGVTTLYRGYIDSNPETLFFASEAKALDFICDRIENFPPGHYFDSETMKLERYFKPDWFSSSSIPTAPVNYKLVRATLEAAVRKRLMSEVPYGVLLSGGLDSSLIASIASREIEKFENSHAELLQDETKLFQSWPKLHTFSIGLVGAPDLIASREVAKFLNTIHHEYTFTLQDGLNALSDVIYHLETYDVTTIRASTPMFLLSRRIKAMGVKMVLSGEGSDEIFGGYLYFANAPNAEEFHKECVKRVNNLHLADCLRANKSTMAWGLEARVPFLDKEFLQLAMNIDPQDKVIKKERMEKYILRKAFDVTDEPSVKPYLPEKFLWRQKEQFSDGVGYSWIDCLKDQANEIISDEEFFNPPPEWSSDIPTTKEAFWYRKMFDSIFTQKVAATVERWIPKADWGCNEDPSGRCQSTHQAYKV